MKDVAADPNALQEHIARTYFSLRIGTAVVGILLPVILKLGGKLLDPPDSATAAVAGACPVGTSMSSYYWSHSMHNVFVGALVTIGACLYLYKGFSKQENVALNLAGIFAVLVALIATPELCGEARHVTAHATFAVLFFLCIAYVCVFRAADTLSLIDDPKKAAGLRWRYRMYGVAMVLVPLGAAAVSFASGETDWKFWLEAFAVWVFAAYWFEKSRELRETDAVQLALERMLVAGGDKRNEMGRIGQRPALIGCPLVPLSAAPFTDARTAGEGGRS